MNDETQKNDEATDRDAGRERNVEIPTHEQEIARLRKEREETEAKLQRALADLQNIRRRQRHEIDDNRHRVLEGLTRELLPILDTFSMALEAYDSQCESADPKALVEGVRMVRSMLSAALERHGLKEIQAEGPFDPGKHEAVSVESTEDVPEGHIVRTLQPGYELGNKVVRFSRVVVSGQPNEDDSSANDKKKSD